MKRCIAVLLTLCTWLGGAAAHKASDAYLFITSEGTQTTLRWDIALRDLDAALLQLDANADRALTWGEVRAAWPAIQALAQRSLQVAHCPLTLAGAAQLEQRSDGAYAVLHAAAACTLDERSAIVYGLFADIDPTHRGILKLVLADGRVLARVLAPDAAAMNAATTPAALAPAAFFSEGLQHILTGWDHLLFLLCLLLPAVLRREVGQWRAVPDVRSAAKPVLITVTLFTLAHSLTLALGALGYVRLSPVFIEPAIALTILLAAIDNIRPLVGARPRSALTFVFGLIHGFGFAGVLAEAQLPALDFVWALLRFNAGIEAGQLAVVLAVVPLLYALRQRPDYVSGMLRWGSSAAGVLATLWLVERTTAISLLPF